MLRRGSHIFYPEVLANSFKWKWKKTAYNVQRTFLSTPMPEAGQMDPNIKSYAELHKFSLEKPEIFWNVIGKRLDWKKQYTRAYDGDFTFGNTKWFNSGTLNASVNCVDRHAQADPNKIALIFEKDEPGQTEFISYAQLKSLVVKYASYLRNIGGVKRGDRVAFYLPCGPTAVAMSLACARIGAIHSAVFAGFSSEALASRINDAKAIVLVTCDEAVRGGRILELKKVADEALLSCPTVKTVFVDARTGTKNVKMSHPRDKYLHELENESVNDHIEYVDSNHPLFILYTSGSTGKPKGLIHSTGGYLVYASFSHQHVFDYRPGDIFGCVADIGWITGHSYVMYGPLVNGGTSLLFESTPIYPNPGRYWEMVERLKLTHFYCAPTAIRVLIKAGSQWVEKYDKSSIRVLGTVGEPINKEAWEWYNKHVGNSKLPIIDTWWQTETGACCLSPRPSGPNDPIIPAMAMRPFYGIKPKLMSDKGEVESEGALCLEQPWPGLAMSIWNDSDRFTETYFKDYKPYYFTGDGAMRSSEGYWKITGRLDDVINVTGHRLGTAEVEDALGKHSLVSESAVVGYPHDLKGEGIFAFVVLRDKASNSAEEKAKIEKELRAVCKSTIAAYAMPDYILFTELLPKTRSGKIMRRILRKIAVGESLENLGDISTLADPSVVDNIVNIRKSINFSK